MACRNGQGASAKVQTQLPPEAVERQVCSEMSQAVMPLLAKPPRPSLSLGRLHSPRRLHEVLASGADDTSGAGVRGQGGKMRRGFVLERRLPGISGNLGLLLGFAVHVAGRAVVRVVLCVQNDYLAASPCRYRATHRRFMIALHCGNLIPESDCLTSCAPDLWLAGVSRQRHCLP